MKISKISLLLFLTLLTNSTYAVKKVYSEKIEPAILKCSKHSQNDFKKKLTEKALEILLYHYVGIVDLFVAKQDSEILSNSTKELKEKINEFYPKFQPIILTENAKLLASLNSTATDEPCYAEIILGSELYEKLMEIKCLADIS